MSVIIPIDLPAREILKREGFADAIAAKDGGKDVPRRIALLNLMPLKEVTEADYIRLLANSPITSEMIFVRLRSHKSKNTSEEHLNKFYRYFDEIINEPIDGLIITGAPVELLAFEDVTYWNELTQIFEWAAKNVNSTLYICWAAQAGLYHFYGIPKYPLAKKQFGVFRHFLLKPELPLFRGFDGNFFVPHSRHTEIRRADIALVPELDLLSESDEAGVYIVMSGNGRSIFVTGHSEYAPERLDIEYRRDLAKGLPIDIPADYYFGNNPQKGVCVRWRAHASLLFTNWLNYYAKRQSV
jgi:homoserine O-succinyltransferase